jgi:hypothetical protein
MPLILKAAGNRIYLRGQHGQAQLHLYGVQEWTHIKDRAEAANLFSFSFPEPCLASGERYIPALRDEIFVYESEADFESDIRWFGGLITQVEDRVITRENSFITRYDIEALSFDILLDKELRQPQKAGLSWQALIAYLMQAHFSTQLSTDYSAIKNPISAPPIRLNNASLRTLLKGMRQLTNHDFYVDAYKQLHVFQASEIPGSFQVTDTPENGLTVWDSRPSLSHEGRTIFNIVRQPFLDQITADQWNGESFTAKGDPKGQGGQLPLLRTPATLDETIYLEEKFDGNAFNSDLWTEIDTSDTQHVDYPNQGYLFPTEGQCQIVGGTGVLGGVALLSQNFYPFLEAAYIVQEFQLTHTAGEGYIALFTDGEGTTTSHFKAGLHIVDSALKALDGTTLISDIGTTNNYLLWVTQTADGWQYDILGGAFATKQTIWQETGITHATDYQLAPIINQSLQGSMNSFRFRKSDYGVLLEINGEKKVVGLESSDTDLPDIDAFLNVDEMPALLKFRAADAIAIIASVSSDTQFTVATGQGEAFKIGQRVLIGDNIIEEFNGQAGVVAGVSGDVITLVAPGISGLALGQQVLINTTVPAKNDKIVVKYGYVKGDEAVASDQASIDKYGPFPTTLDEKDHIKRFDDAQMEADNVLEKYKDGILTLQFTSNNQLIPMAPEPLSAIPVKFSRRPNPISKTLILQRVEITPQSGTGYKYNLTLESADPIQPFSELFQSRSLVLGSDGTIRFSLNLSEWIVLQNELAVRAVSAIYIHWENPEHRYWGEFKWKTVGADNALDFSNLNNSQYLPLF